MVQHPLGARHTPSRTALRECAHIMPNRITARVHTPGVANKFGLCAQSAASAPTARTGSEKGKSLRCTRASSQLWKSRRSPSPWHIHGARPYCVRSSCAQRTAGPRCRCDAADRETVDRDAVRRSAAEDACAAATLHCALQCLGLHIGRLEVGRLRDGRQLAEHLLGRRGQLGCQLL